MAEPFRETEARLSPRLDEVREGLDEFHAVQAEIHEEMMLAYDDWDYEAEEEWVIEMFKWMGDGCAGPKPEPPFG